MLTPIMPNGITFLSLSMWQFVTDINSAHVSFILQFLGALVDNSRTVRYAARKILKILKLNDLAMFKSSIDVLLENLDSYPQVCFILFRIVISSNGNVRYHVNFLNFEIQVGFIFKNM